MLPSLSSCLLQALLSLVLHAKTLAVTQLLYPPWPLEEGDSHKQQSIKTKHYRTQQSTGKKKSGLTPHTPSK